MWYGRETSLTLHPHTWVPYHMALTNQLSINQLTKGQFIVWHIRPYYDTTSHIIEHW